MHHLPAPILEAIEAARVPSPPQMLLRLLQMVDDDRTTMGPVGRSGRARPRIVHPCVAGCQFHQRCSAGINCSTWKPVLVALGTRLIRSIAHLPSLYKPCFDRRNGRRPRADLADFWGALATGRRNSPVALPHRSLTHAPTRPYLAGLLSRHRPIDPAWRNRQSIRPNC
jgi:hypothetical protein